jgi:RNA recognition motif-containing protein
MDLEVRLLTVFSIVEYATREQAQQAVNTLSNQNLMGRLVYVREVCDHEPLLRRLDFANLCVRTVRPNLDLPGHPLELAADTKEDKDAVDSVVEVDLEAAWLQVVVVAVKSTSPTFVTSSLLILQLLGDTNFNLKCSYPIQLDGKT